MLMLVSKVVFRVLLLFEGGGIKFVCALTTSGRSGVFDGFFWGRGYVREEEEMRDEHRLLTFFDDLFYSCWKLT